MLDKTYTTADAFKALDGLNEELFELSDDGIGKLTAFYNGDAVDSFQDRDLIYDSTAETEADLKDSYIGDVVLACPVCTSKYYKSPEDVVIDDEDATLCNVGEKCPICNSESGYKIIGQVAEYCGKDGCDNKDSSEEGVEPENKELTVTESLKQMNCTIKPKKSLLSESIRAKYHRSANTESRLNKLKSIKESLDKEEVCSRCHKEPCECKDKEMEELKEDIQKVEVKTDTDNIEIQQEEGKLTVETSKPEDEQLESAETIAPIDQETKERIKQENDIEETEDSEPVVEPEDEYEDIDIDEFDETEFDELEEKYLKEVYDNVKSYKTTGGGVKDNAIILEGVIEFNSGKKVKTNYVFEADRRLKNGKVKLNGINEQFAKSKNAFVITGRVVDKKLISESLTYNYSARDSKTQTSSRVYGRVTRGK